MDVSVAASFFDDLVCTDAYGTDTFLGQFTLFDDVRRDGMTSSRRIISTNPSITLPARGVFDADGQQWIIGESFNDYFYGEPIRRKSIVHQADGLASVYTLADKLADSPLLTAYAAKSWVKGSKEVEESSRITNVYDIFFSRHETIPLAALVDLDGLTYIVRQDHKTEGGFTAVSVDELGSDIRKSVTYYARVYEPVSDSYSAASATGWALHFRWQSHFRYLSQASRKFEHGDELAIVLKTFVTPSVNDIITIDSVDHRVVSFGDDGDCWALHIERK